MERVSIEIRKRGGHGEMIQAYRHSPSLAIHKSGHQEWTVTHIPTGNAFKWECNRRKDAILIADEIVAFFGKIPDTEDAIRQILREQADGKFYYYLLTVGRYGSGIGTGHSKYVPVMTFKKYCETF